MEIKIKEIILLVLFLISINFNSLSQKYEIKNNDIRITYSVLIAENYVIIETAVFNLTDYTLYINHLVNQQFMISTNNEINDHEMIVDNGVFLIKHPTYNIAPCLQKINANDSACEVNVFKIASQDTISLVKNVIFNIDYLIPGHYSLNDYNTIMNNLNLHSNSIDYKFNLYTLPKEIFGKYSNYITINKPLVLPK